MPASNAVLHNSLKSVSCQPLHRMFVGVCNSLRKSLLDRMHLYARTRWITSAYNILELVLGRGFHSVRVNASPLGVVASIIMLKTAGVGGDIRSAFGTRSTIAARPPGASAACTFRRNLVHVGISKWCKKLVMRTRSYPVPNSVSNASPGIE